MPSLSDAEGKRMLIHEGKVSIFFVVDAAYCCLSYFCLFRRIPKRHGAGVKKPRCGLSRRRRPAKRKWSSPSARFATSRWQNTAPGQRWQRAAAQASAARSPRKGSRATAGGLLRAAPVIDMTLGVVLAFDLALHCNSALTNETPARAPLRAPSLAGLSLAT